MSAERADLEVMRCVSCRTIKAWRDGFPNRTSAICWECMWARHVSDAHWWVTWRARRVATRQAKRVAIWKAQQVAISDLRQDLISGGKS